MTDSIFKITSWSWHHRPMTKAGLATHECMQPEWLRHSFFFFFKQHLLSINCMLMWGSVWGSKVRFLHLRNTPSWVSDPKCSEFASLMRGIAAWGSNDFSLYNIPRCSCSLSTISTARTYRMGINLLFPLPPLYSNKWRGQGGGFWESRWGDGCTGSWTDHQTGGFRVFIISRKLCDMRKRQNLLGAIT